MARRAFDLNVEEVLENWEIEHAVREVIANALDEQVLSNTANIQIAKDSTGNWHIRDFGRGLRIEHFTLNENPEKLAAPSGVIGKFGVGLKDALATFHRRGVNVLVRSQFGTFRTTTEHKHGFDNIITLHSSMTTTRMRSIRQARRRNGYADIE
jgi:DNA gyrase/topoisomerase IV subunit B